MTTETASPFVVAAETGRSRWGVVGMCAGMTAAGVALILFGGLLGLVVGAVGVAFFGALCLPLVTMWAIRPVPRLVISPTGIAINRYAVSDVGMLGWDDVTTVGVSSSRSSSWVTVTVGDPAGFLRRQPRVRRALLRLNGWDRLPVVRVTSTALPVSARDVEGAITAMRGNPPDDDGSIGR